MEYVSRAKARGYFVRMFFIGTTDPTINAARVAARIMAGGHSVPIDKIISRYTRSVGNMAAAVGLIDRAYFYDNSLDGVEARLVARTVDGELRKIYGNIPKWLQVVVSGLPKHADFVDLRGG